MLSTFLKDFSSTISLDYLSKVDEDFRLDFKKVIYQLIDEYQIQSHQLLMFFSNQFHFPIFDLKQFEPQWIDDSPLTPSLFIKNWFLPLNAKSETQQIGIIVASQIINIQFLISLIQKPIQFYLVDALALRRLIQLHCQNCLWDQNLKQHSLSFSSPNIETELDTDQEEPVIQFVNQLIEQGAQKKISDIHLESLDSHYRLRFRQDGLLTPAGELSHAFAQRVIARIKILAKLDITEKRIPQDGRFQYDAQHRIHVRVSSSPGVLGEKLVLRLLENLHRDLSLQHLGLEDAQLALFKAHLAKPQGLILVTGATGSGKTMTLYAALKHLNTLEKNICSVEDPVEIYLDGIHQVNVHDFIELHFSNVLRAFLRQDPDIIMIGEIRDAASAQVAVEAAQTGHLVLATLHTNSAHESINRFLNLKIPDYLLASALSLVISQRLLRRLCDKCKIPDDQVMHTHFKNQFTHPIYKAQGCDYCQQGYQGRIGIFECLAFNPQLVFSIIQNNLGTSNQSQSHLTLWDAGLLKVNAGMTSLEELYRVSHPI